MRVTDLFIYYKIHHIELSPLTQSFNIWVEKKMHSSLFFSKSNFQRCEFLLKSSSLFFLCQALLSIC